MLAPKPTNSTIVARYLERTPGSSQLADQARTLLPSGITHDSRYLNPYGIYVERASGSHKWDVDGNEYVDYFGGHGALLLGHAHPKVMAAVTGACGHGTHFGANHAMELRWAQLVLDLVPCAERVRFTSSGTEATHMALRLARAFTGRRKLVRFLTHFHGWHDHMTSGYSSHNDGTPTVGVLAGVSDQVVLLAPGDEAGIRRVLATDKDVAAVFIEPTGANFGRVPLEPGYLHLLRELCTEHGVLLIFDEVVTGFRVSPGGAQAHFGVTPDLTTLAKILVGGLPGGAVTGRKAIMDALDFEATQAAGKEKIEHPGTFNANPVSAAAGVAALELVANSDACERANSLGASMRAQLRDVLARERVPWGVYGTFSGFHIYTNPDNHALDPQTFNCAEYSYTQLKTNRRELLHKLRLAMLVNGVDFSPSPGGLLSAAHTEDDIAATAAAFGEAVRALRLEGEIPS
ncbi:MAG: aspartate aminotransferase family protein [Gammaproteobacteria bacterium]